jgi:PhnB protein
MAVKYIPEGYHTLTPYLSIKGAADALEFYKQAFNAVELFRLPTPNGEVGHAEIMIGDSHVMMADQCAESPIHNPPKLGGSTVGLHVYVEDVDALFAQAIKAGATEVTAVEDKFYGDRLGTLRDPFGHIWFLSTHKEELTPEEINKRAERLFKSDDD